jgi:hypothetical protein
MSAALLDPRDVLALTHQLEQCTVWLQRLTLAATAQPVPDDLERRQAAVHADLMQLRATLAPVVEAVHLAVLQAATAGAQPIERRVRDRRLSSYTGPDRRRPA